VPTQQKEDYMNAAGTGKLAVVTGASSGIGFEFAKVLIENDFEVLMVAEDDVDAAAASLGVTGAKVMPLRADLSTHDGNERLVAAVAADGRAADVLALNAGVGVAGPFLETPIDADLALLELNINSPVYLAKRLLPAMVASGEGRVLITSSIAGTMPGPYYATYAASKAFLLSFAEAIRYELKDTGVTVTALMPGPTDTNFFDRAGMEDTLVYEGQKDDPADVARDAFKALMAGDDKVVAGSAKNAVQVAMGKVMPETAKATLHARQVKPEDEHG
jgi:short-subunit dehydrogenase